MLCGPSYEFYNEDTLIFIFEMDSKYHNSLDYCLVTFSCLLNLILIFPFTWVLTKFVQKCTCPTPYNFHYQLLSPKLLLWLAINAKLLAMWTIWISKNQKVFAQIQWLVALVYEIFWNSWYWYCCKTSSFGLGIQWYNIKMFKSMLGFAKISILWCV